MFEKITPEQAGISSKVITEFLTALENCGATTHGVLFMKDEKIFAEGYWKPFHQDFCHRMYSQTKSFVGVAIGLLEEEGKLSLEDKIVDYFPEKIDGELPKYLNEQTIKDMLTMCTVGNPAKWWFTANDPDRVHLYFNDQRTTHPSGTYWQYDSPGSQVLSVLVEKLSGKKLLTYLKEKLFNEMGVFQTAKILQTPNGDSWGDSAMICTLRDMAAFGQFVMNYGVWKGKRLMNEKYLREATSKVVDNKENAYYKGYSFGYGYQIWRVGGNGFAFVGMGNQFTICYPDKNFLFACTSDDQGTTLPREMIFTQIRDVILPAIQEKTLPEDKLAHAELVKKMDGLTLRAAKGADDSPFREALSGIEYICDENRMGITKFSFVFKDKTTGEFRYTNGQGDKVIPFGVNHNVFGQFPQLGYSREFGGMKTTDGFTYRDAASCAWLEDKKLLLYVQIIDEYFGNMSAIFSFKDNYASALFTRAAENFLTEYEGVLTAKKQ